MNGNVSSPSALNQLKYDFQRVKEDKVFWENQARSLELEVQTIREQLAFQEQQFSLREQLMKRLERRVSELNEDTDGLRQENTSYLKESSQLDNDTLQEKENSHKRYEALEQSLDESESARQRSEAAAAELKVCLQKLKSEKEENLERLQRETAELRTCNISSKEKIKTLEKSLREKTWEICQTEKSKNEEIFKLLEELNEKEDIIRAKEGPEIELRLNVSKLEDTLLEKEQECTFVLARLFDMEGKLMAGTNERAELEKEIARLRTAETEIEVVRQRLLVANEEHNRTTEEMRGDVLKLAGQCQETQEELVAARIIIQELHISEQNIQIGYEKSVQALETELSCLKTELAKLEAAKLEQDNQCSDLTKAFGMLTMERNAEKLLKDNAMVQVKAQEEEITALKRELLLTQNCNQDVLCVDPVSLQATSPLSKWSSQPSGDKNYSFFKIEFGSMVLPEFGSAMKLGGSSSRSGSSFPLSESQLSHFSAQHLRLNEDEPEYVQMEMKSIPVRETHSSPVSKAPPTSHFTRTATLRAKFFRDSGFSYKQDTPTRNRELADRNARLPNHLKSSYPVENNTPTWRHSSSSNEKSKPTTPPSSCNELVQKTSAFKKLRRSIIKKKIRWNGGEKSAEKTVVNDSSAMRPGPLKGKHKPAESFEVLNTPKKKKKL